MQSRLLVRLLQHRAPKNSDFKTQGFTLLELLVAVVIGGILAAIAIPSFLSRANTAKQVEAKMYLGSLNRSQQAFYAEHGRFGKSPQELGLYSQPTSNYEYQVDIPNDGSLRAVHYANSRVLKLRPYAGMVALVRQGSVMATVLCEAEEPALGPATPPTVDDASVACSPGTKALN
ncbi:type IV pilin-like G/H family protein [Leptodesmis sp.]|uniref:type IV pilin-like G/H family protein n=1 Tax=Leptodesmis sp. TaxID=3100501 RepID=UPI0040534877